MKFRKKSIVDTMGRLMPFMHGNQFSYITFSKDVESSKQSNIIFEIAFFDLDVDLYCLTILRASFL